MTGMTVSISPCLQLPFGVSRSALPRLFYCFYAVVVSSLCLVAYRMPGVHGLPAQSTVVGMVKTTSDEVVLRKATNAKRNKVRRGASTSTLAKVKTAQSKMEAPYCRSLSHAASAM
jgi:hypothetical protein